jgi:hypothetical protein
MDLTNFRKALAARANELAPRLAEPEQNQTVKMRFPTAAGYCTEIQRLEKELGLPSGPPIFNMRHAAARLAELETMRDRFFTGATPKTISERPTVSVNPYVAPGSFTTTALPPAAPALSREKLIMVGNVLSIDTRGMTDEQMQAAIQAAATAQGIQLPGQPAVERTGSAMRKALLATKQNCVDEILKPAKR